MCNECFFQVLHFTQTSVHCDNVKNILTVQHSIYSFIKKNNYQNLENEYHIKTVIGSIVNVPEFIGKYDPVNKLDAM